MLKWALIFFVISLVAGLFGFTNIAAGARTIARVLFVLALIVFVIFLILALAAGSMVIRSAARVGTPLSTLRSLMFWRAICPLEQI